MDTNNVVSSNPSANANSTIINSAATLSSTGSLQTSSTTIAANNNINNNSISNSSAYNSSSGSTGSGGVIVPGAGQTDADAAALALAASISDQHQQQQQQQQQQQHQQQQQQQRSSGFSSGSASATAASPLQSPATKARKTVGRNNNGTMVSTSTPANEAELQLYRVLQRASLLAYYDTLLEMGGDDVQQLCDAGEEEFLEIMALVGMASKPLHVRRLQKSLHEWAMSPGSFQAPLSQMDSATSAFSPEHAPQSRSPFSPSQAYSPSSLGSTQMTTGLTFGSGLGIGSVSHHGQSQQHHPAQSSHHSQQQMQQNLSGIASQHQQQYTSGSNSTMSSQQSSLSGGNHPNNGTGSAASGGQNQATPALTDGQMSRLAAVAEEFSRGLPPLEPKPHNSKKRSSKDLELVLSMNECDPRRMEEIRKYAAIYGRFDCKRRPEKPLSVHELCVNEAASQLCRLIPALLFRRDELFHHARKVVRKSGFGPSAEVPSFKLSPSRRDHHHHHHHAGDSPNPSKRLRLDGSNSTATVNMLQGNSIASADFTKETAEEMRNNLLAIYQKLGRSFDMSDVAKFSNYSRSEYDDNDSTYSFSNSSSPPLQSLNGVDHDFSASELTEDDHKTASADLRCRSPFDVQLATANHVHMNASTQHHHLQSPPQIGHPQHQQQLQQQHHTGSGSSPNGLQHGGVHVIAASGAHIIAVANPALALSTTLTAVETAGANVTTAGQMMAAIKRECMSPGPCDM